MNKQDQLPFWKRKTMSEFSQEEWESICDGCGRCCLQKLEDEDSGEVYYTDVVCQYFDQNGCRCTQYEKRFQLVPQCVKLNMENIDQFFWLPATCSYKLLHDYGDLPPWHPLVSGDVATVVKAGVSIKGKVISEANVAESEWEDRVITWIE